MTMRRRFAAFPVVARMAGSLLPARWQRLRRKLRALSALRPPLENPSESRCPGLCLLRAADAVSRAAVVPMPGRTENIERSCMNMSIVSRQARLRLPGLLAAAVLAGCGSHAATEGHMPPAEVSAAPVLVERVSPWDEFTGRIEAVETVELRPRVGGYIERVDYKEGDEVNKGDVLFVIDQRSYRADLARAEAELARARSHAELTAGEARRAETLAQSKVISVEQYEQRRAAAAEALAQLRAAEAARDLARLNLEFTLVRAPIAGRAGRALVTAGNLVGPEQGSVLTTIVALDTVHVYFEADEQTYLRYAAQARSGDKRSAAGGNPVRVGLAGDEGYPHEGVLDFIDNQVNPGTGTIRARAVLSNAQRVFTPGLFARVQLLGGEPYRALLIDDKAVLTDQDRKYVYVVGEGDIALRKDVVLGARVDGLRVVKAGLAPGDRVIVHGVQKVFFPGMPVQAQAVAMGDPPPLPAGMAH